MGTNFKEKAAVFQLSAAAQCALPFLSFPSPVPCVCVPALLVHQTLTFSFSFSLIFKQLKVTPHTQTAARLNFPTLPNCRANRGT